MQVMSFFEVFRILFERLLLCLEFVRILTIMSCVVMEDVFLFDGACGLKVQVDQLVFNNQVSYLILLFIKTRGVFSDMHYAWAYYDIISIFRQNL